MAATQMSDGPGNPRALWTTEPSPDRVIERLLRVVREHLDLDVAFVGELVGDERVFRYVDSRCPGASVVRVGDGDPLERSYCHHVLAGRVPQFLRDPSEHPVTASLAVTAELPVGTHLSVPIQFSDGRTYGTFCCFATQVHSSLGARDLASLRMAAELAAEHLESIDAARAERERRRRVVRQVLEDPNAMTLVFQPVRRLETMEIVAFEALARFPLHEHGPAWFFNEAARVGLGVELEMRAVRLALAALERIPAPIRLNVNVSPFTLCSPEFSDTIAGVPADRLIVEVTEHAAIDDYTELRTVSARLRTAGVQLAIDDVGMGFSGLTRILETAPQQLKLDAAVVRDVDRDLVKQALIESFRSFGERAQLDVLAEGIETAAERAEGVELGVTLGQGYHLGRPAPLDSALPASAGRVARPAAVR